jgi:hypothetical protein
MGKQVYAKNSMICRQGETERQMLARFEQLLASVTRRPGYDGMYYLLSDGEDQVVIEVKAYVR